MIQLEERKIVCPYCGEMIVVLIEPMGSIDSPFDAEYIDTENQTSEYIEDCQVCCRPITLQVSQESSGAFSVDVFHENE